MKNCAILVSRHRGMVLDKSFSLSKKENSETILSNYAKIDEFSRAMTGPCHTNK